MSTPDPQLRLRGFLRALRAEGLLVGVDEMLDTLACLQHGPVVHGASVHQVIRALACSTAHEWRRYEDLFLRFWFPALAPVDEDDAAAIIDPRVRRRQRGVVGLAGATAEPQTDSDRPGLIGTGAGRQKTLTRTDYRFLNDRVAMREAERLAERLATLLRTRISRRKIVRPRGSTLDIRRTLRRNLSRGGFPVDRLYRSPRRLPTELVILHDISHSMSWHNPLLYRFIRGVVRAVPSSHAFAFHTRLFPVTEIYREQSLERMRERLEADNKLWLGGTCIADSVRQFKQQWARQTLVPRSVVVIVSDGFDTDTPEALARQLNNLKQSCAGIVWLNPMLGREGYRLDPAALELLTPHVHDFLPAHSIDALTVALGEIARLSRC